MDRDEIIDRVGAQEWRGVVEWFGGMDYDEILEELNSYWCEDNEELAAAIEYQLRR